MGHDDGLGGGGGAVIVGSVADLHARQLADHGLVLKDGLQGPLADLGLVGGVGGEELAAADHVADHAGHKAVVGARAHETGRVVQIGVGLGHGAQLGHQLDLGQRLGQVEMGVTHVLRDDTE